MKQGISLFSFTDSTDVRWMFEHAKKAGYDGVEPVMSENGYLNPSTPEKDILAMRRMAEDMGLEIPSVGVWSLWENNLVSDSPAIREKAFGIVEKQIEAAHLLGADTILVVPGYVGCSFASKPEKIRYDVAYARSQEAAHHKHFRFTLTTNGVLLDDEVTEFCNREMHNVVLSLDGRKAVHDRLRKNYAGQGSYDLIVPKFQRFVQQRGDRDYYIRGTFTHENTDFTNDIFHMADLGFTELSMEPVVSPPGEPWALTEEDLPVLFEQYEILAREMLKREEEGRPFTFYHYMLDLEGGPCLHKRMSGCGSGTEYLAVTPWGELFPCHQFVNDPAYSMGDVWKGVTNTTMGEKFHRCNVVANPACRDCWARLYCAGGCAANAYHASGDINGTYEYGCELFKKRIECAIMIKAAQAGRPR